MNARNRAKAASRGSKPLKDQTDKAPPTPSLSTPGAAATGFLTGSGEMADRIRRHDWSATPLGPIETWPQSLKTATGLLIAAPVPIVMLWGPTGVMIYNDAYSIFAGGRHPELLGSNVREGWPEVADFNDNVMKVGLAGGTLAYKDQELVLYRHGQPEQVWMDLDYWPVPDEDGRPAGIIATVVETTARVLADRERSETNDRLQLALSAGRGVGTWDWDLAADSVVADERFAQLYGVDPAMARAGAPIADFFGAMHPDDAGRVNDEIVRTLETQEPFRSEYRLVQADGEVRWVAAEGRIILDEAGRPARFPGVTFDITDRRRTDAALVETEARYGALFGAISSGFCIVQMKFDEAGRPVDYMIVEGNAAFEEMTGLRNANGKWVSEIAPGLEQHWFDLYGGVALTGEAVRFENPADIFGRWYEGQALRVGDPAERRVAILFNNVTEQKQAETRQSVLLDLNDAVRDLTDAAEIAHASSRILAEALNVSRVGYGVMDTVAETVTIARDYNAPGVQSIAGVIHFRDFGDYIENLARGEAVIFADAGEDPRVTDGGAALDTISARALINLPLIEQGKVVALLFVNNATPRIWSDEDVALVREVAERVRVATERARAVGELQASEKRLKFFDALGLATENARDADEVLKVTTRMTAQHLGVTNCAYADMDEDQDGFTIRDDWAAPGSPSIVGHYSLADFGALAVQELGAGRPLIVNDNLSELAPEEAQAFQSIGIGATICMPLVKQGVLTALMAIHHKTAHLWTDEELTTIREVTERSWAHVERVRAQAELAASEADLRQQREELARVNGQLEVLLEGSLAERDRLWELSQDMLARANYGGGMSAVNPAWTRILGWSEQELLTNPYADIIDPENLPATAAALEEMQRTGLPTRFENRILTNDGVWTPIGWTVAPEPDGVNFIAVGRDLTEDKARERQLAQAQEALRQSQKMEAVGQLTGGIAHDFNNLLAGISGSLELLGKRLSEGRLNGMERYIDAAQGSAQRAASLTQRLLAFSRRQTLDPKPTDVNRLINGMEDLIRRSVGPDVEVEVVGAGGLWATQIDQSQLENALLNLCINARDAMAPGGGRLTIETANKWLDARHASQRDLPPGQYVSLCVTDTGTGMSPEIQAQAFDPFFTTKPLGQGTGLGLSMIHGFVRQSGGQVRIYSELGKGTTMCLYLPRHLGEVDGQDIAEDAPVAEGGHGETVLIIDDEETVRMLVAEVLGDAGYHVIEAPDGPAGLEILRSQARIDLLISDVGLPGGMNGRQVADAARETRPALKVLFITGYAENAAVGNGLLAPGMEVLTKPFVMADLALKVHDMIETPAS